MSGYLPIGMGVGAGIVEGRVNLVAGPLFAQIERERAEGPRHVEAVAATRVMRSKALIARCLLWGSRSHSLPHCQPVTTDEFHHGIPDGWIAR